MQSISPQTDYVYDIKEVRKIESAFQDLKQSEARGLKYGLGTWVFSHWALSKTFRLSHGTKSFLGLLLGATAFNLYTHAPRVYYASISTEVNTKISKQLNAMIH